MSKRPNGTIRQSQVITTFGPGAMVDLPHGSVIVGGLESWRGDKKPVVESRLEEKVRELLELPSVSMFAPPVWSDDPLKPSSGIAGYQFPEWFVAQHEVRREDGARARPLVHRRGLTTKGMYEFADPKKGGRTTRPVVPVRFVQACLNGHVSDIHWHAFIHCAGGCQRPLWMDEYGASGDLRDVFIRCECGTKRSMIDAMRPGGETLGFCGGQRPWLGADSWEACHGEGGTSLPNKLLLRSASDAYFAQVLRVIAIPDPDQPLREAVAKVWDDYLQTSESFADVAHERKKAKVAAALEGFSDSEVFAEVERRKGGLTSATSKKVKQPEIETLMRQQEEIGADAPEGADFYARRIRIEDEGGEPALEKVDRVVLVHRLREAMALVGFTRFESAMPDIDGELSLEVRRAPLARETTWVPAVENRGEGFFIAFKAAALGEWFNRPKVQERKKQLEAGFAISAKRNSNGGLEKFPGMRYVMLHSLSHMLISAVSMECGYSASAIRERIYVGDAGNGILLYTGTPDAEGTLGGLVSVGRKLARHLTSALELGRLCSNDPVCAQHRPDDAHAERFLLGAACHGCLLIAEPSCETRNEFLDRSLVVDTVDALDAEFFLRA
jgi:hypothetical protein